MAPPRPHARPSRLLPLLLVWAGALVAAPATAQDRLDRPIRVFLDCQQFYCDQSFFTEQIPWVDFVRDRQSADIHVLGTRQTTGAGGSAYTLEFRGRGPFDGQALTLRTAVLPDATESERRDELVSVTRLGLAPFARATPVGPRVEIVAPEQEQESPAAGRDDPWDRWVFRIGLNGFANGESRQRFLNSRASVNASRVTAQWKLMGNLSSSVSNNEFELNDTTTFTSRRETHSGEVMVVRSAGRHWGAGSILAWERSTFTNYDHSLVLGAAAEYNVFPYSESNRRLLTLLYAVGPRYNDYSDPTIFDETAETVIEQMLVVNYDVTQPWGNIDVSGSVNHYVTKFGTGREWTAPQYNASLSGGVNLRLIRGLSARLFGSIGLVRGQIHLSAADLTEEEILTQQRELATNYRYSTSFGLSYRFGSIFSEVVNPRFEGI